MQAIVYTHVKYHLTRVVIVYLFNERRKISLYQKSWYWHISAVYNRMSTFVGTCTRACYVLSTFVYTCCFSQIYAISRGAHLYQKYWYRHISAVYNMLSTLVDTVARSFVMCCPLLWTLAHARLLCVVHFCGHLRTFACYVLSTLVDTAAFA